MADAEKHQDSTRPYCCGTWTLSPALRNLSHHSNSPMQRSMFSRGAAINFVTWHCEEKFPNEKNVWSNQKCLEEAHRFFNYAYVEGFRGSPHKL